MKRLLLSVVAVTGLLFATSPRSDACSTHGYVRASTLNDLFNGVGNQDNGLEFAAGNQPFDPNNPANTQLSNVSLDTSSFDDEHALEVHLKGQNNDQWISLSIYKNLDGTSVNSGQAQVDDIISAVEQSLSEGYDQRYAN
jgi:hypothetical protein